MVITEWAKLLDNRVQVDIHIGFWKSVWYTPLMNSLQANYLAVESVARHWNYWVPVLKGVPQGTVLGPLLFSLYINYITSAIESEIRLFADDCVMTAFAIAKLRMKKTQWNFRGVLIDWVAGQGNGVWDFNLSNATYCSWLENGSRRSMLGIL